MLRLLRPALPIVVLMAALAPVRADDQADRQEAAKAVLAQMHSAEMVENLVPSIIGQIRINLTHNDPTLVKQFDTIVPRLTVAADAAKPQLMQKLIDVYAKTFTTAELRDMEAYYKSPVGQRIIATQGQINHDMLEVARDWGNGVATTMAQTAAAELQGGKTP